MLLNHLQKLSRNLKYGILPHQKRFYGGTRISLQTVRHAEEIKSSPMQKEANEKEDITEPMTNEIFPSAPMNVVPMMLSNRDPIVLPFEEVPGPISLKFLARFRNYLSEVGTQLTAGALTLGLSVGTYVTINRKPAGRLSSLFDRYGPVVRFVSPVGGDLVLINNPEHIQKVFTMEGDKPVRSTLDSLEKYRNEHRHNFSAGLYNDKGEHWSRQRSIVTEPINIAVTRHMKGLEETCNSFIQKIYNSRDYRDEITKNLYKEIHKWAFDCMGLLVFSKKFTMLETEVVYSQCDMSWLYHSLERSTDALMKCESGLQLWKLFPTPAWKALVQHCDTLDNLIGKHVLEVEQKLSIANSAPERSMDLSLIHSMLTREEKMASEDIATVLMDMLLIGVNTITSSMSFMMYFLAKHQKVQKQLYQEIHKLNPDANIDSIDKIKYDIPFLQACIRETLRLMPPIPILTRVLPKNVILDKYNIPRGTLIIMSTQDASLKESNFDDATRFHPQRWLESDSKDYHAFASIPFGFGARKCLGQNIAETMLALLTVKMIQKFKLEYHYGEIYPTNSFIVKPNKALKIRFIDRM